VIEVCRVGKKFQSTTRGVTAALRDMSLTVEDGEFVCLVGPSGCGKTTLLNLIGGLERPDDGEVRVHGKRVRGPGPDRGVMFQDAALFPWLSVAENVKFGMKELRVGRDEREARAKKYLDLVKMSGFARAWVHELSGGMKQRVALARALAPRPRLVLLDEPFSAMDRELRRDFIADVRAYVDEARVPLIHVTHHRNEARALADRVVLIDGGRITASGGVDELLPASRDLLDDSLRIHTRE